MLLVIGLFCFFASFGCFVVMISELQGANCGSVPQAYAIVGFLLQMVAIFIGLFT